MIFQSNSSDIERLKIQHQIQVDVAEKEIAALKAEVKDYLKAITKAQKLLSEELLNDDLPNWDKIYKSERTLHFVIAKHKKEGEV